MCHVSNRRKSKTKFVGISTISLPIYTGKFEYIGVVFPESVDLLAYISTHLILAITLKLDFHVCFQMLLAQSEKLS